MMRMMIITGMLWASVAAADHHDRSGQVKVNCNQNGVVLTLQSGRKLYLGKTCDAFAPGEGKGRWWYAASALAAQTGGQTRRFEFDINCPALPYCRP